MIAIHAEAVLLISSLLAPSVSARTAEILSTTYFMKFSAECELHVYRKVGCWDAFQ